MKRSNRLVESDIQTIMTESDERKQGGYSPADFLDLQQKMAEALLIPPWIFYGLSEEEWILKRLFMTDQELQDERWKRSYARHRWH